jgi:hypothetical protein
MEMISLVAIRTGPDRKTGRWSNFDERCSHGIGRLFASSAATSVSMQSRRTRSSILQARRGRGDPGERPIAQEARTPPSTDLGA